jgi:hypothetical protein
MNRGATGFHKSHEGKKEKVRASGLKYSEYSFIFSLCGFYEINTGR